ncbi:MAG: sugar phosphate isomerase/epimerase [Hyphomicrobiales bacterium]|nr:sugar phosphate isomerase/epimerase [Hyphomicrobiales bacterium]
MTPDTVELVASYWTLCGDVYAGGPDEVSPFDFRDRVETASRVGYRGMGFVHADIMAVADRLGFPTMKRILDDNGMKYVEVEIIMDWFTDGERRARSNAVRRDLLKAAEALDACHIKIGANIEDNGTKVWPREKMAADFAELCDQAAGIGKRIALELMPFSNLRTIDQGLQLITDAGTTNGGLMLDVWHLARGGIDFGEIRKVPKELIFWVEIDDADPDIVENLWVDTIHHRRLPGEGSFDIQAFLEAVRDVGYTNPCGVEIISSVHRALPLEEAARRAYDTAIRQFQMLEPGAGAR